MKKMPRLCASCFCCLVLSFFGGCGGSAPSGGSVPSALTGKSKIEADKCIVEHGKDAIVHYLKAAMERDDEESLSLKYVEYFVSQGADVNAKDAKNWTPLLVVAASGNIDVVEFLVFQGADVNAKHDRDFTPLHRAAAWNKDVEVAKFLVSKGADINAHASYNQFSGTPLDWAKKAENTAMIECLSGLK